MSISIVPPYIMLVSLFWWNDLPEKAALRAVAVIVVFGVLLGYKGKRMRASVLIEALKSTGIGVLEIIMIGAAVIIMGVLIYIIGTVFYKGLPSLTWEMITKIPGGGFYLMEKLRRV